jgi:Na+/melibiose symporter-like transporter
VEDKTANIKSDLKMLVMNRLWKVLFFAAILTLAFVAMKSAVTVHFFKYYVGDEGTPYFLFMDRSTLFMTLGMLALIPGCACTKLLTHRFEKKTLVPGYPAGYLLRLDSLSILTRQTLPCLRYALCLPSYRHALR